ncbi:hypothetical protein [Mucilaginibacter aquatilis]|uniref:Uncharacterized protein n=1 Tax=Mucilaginibacter aquatilis TaxID=1517760 RepID=A0A6I4IQ79_9SPHI|nr:hypothetical protein [Mucilaginibacter aquatilis]MVN91273.1 hypothetical protein [Mucilaginibacter aquatilis]
MKILPIVITIIIIALLVFLGVKFLKSIEKINDKLPGKFNHYQSIDSLKTIKSGGIQLKLLITGQEEIQSIITKDNNVILYSISDKDTNTFIKLNGDGDVIDSLVISCRPYNLAFVNGFIIDKKNNEYYNWSLTGKKTPIKIEVQNASFSWDVENEKEEIKKIAKESSAVYVDFKEEELKPQPQVSGKLQAIQAMKMYTVLTYFNNDKCIQFSTRQDVSKYFPYSYTEELLVNSLFKHIDTAARRQKKFIKSVNVNYKLFQRTKYEKVRFSGGGGNAPGFDVELYHGNLFTDIAFKKDTLRLKEFMYQDKSWQQSEITVNGIKLGTLTKNKAQPPIIIEGYGFYTNPQLGYALFTNDDKKVYIIK